jgi:DNA modification methylase
MENTLYYGDNLDILKRYVKDESVDLVYLDPPFNSNANYNVLFAEKDGSKAASQIQAFTDTWTWSQDDEAVFAEIVTAGGRVADCLQAFRTFLGPCDMLAYLVMMAPRLVELRRVMKSTASIYLHCDPTASHYLKLLMDAVFGPENFINEVSWLRSGRRSSIYKIYRRAHDILLFYSKTKIYTFNLTYQEKDDTLLSKYTLEDENGIYRLVPLMGSGKVASGETGKPWRGYDPNSRGKAGMHWLTIHNNLEAYVTKSLVVFPKKSDGVPQLKYYLSQNKGIPLSDFWHDIDLINSMGNESLGYPTQKPEALLERIIKASSNEMEVVLDPFCGCGTSISAAQALNRAWIGIDITHLAITLIKTRLKDTFGAAAKFNVQGEPASVPDAAALATADPYQFQWWSLGLVGARPIEQKKGSDKGIDGKIIFQGEKPGQFESVIISVKAGNTGAAHVRDLKGVLEREKAAIGVLISMEEPTKPMRTEAITAGFYETAIWKKFPKIQLLTITELLAGKQIEMPPIQQLNKTFKKAPKAKEMPQKQRDLL